MTTTEILLFAGLALFIVATQLGQHPVGLRRFLTPCVAVVAVAVTYLKGIPTSGGDLPFEMVCTLAGVAFGLLAAACVRVGRDAATGRLVLRAGLAYAAVWVLAFGGRIAFGWAARTVWRDAVMQFSLAHQITGAAAWTAAFVLMAVAMVATRTVVLLVRVLLVTRAAPALQALPA